MKIHSLKETILIVGAGAHVPYGMPTGKTLRENIINLVQPQAALSDKSFPLRSEAIEYQLGDVMGLLEAHFIRIPNTLDQFSRGEIGSKELSEGMGSMITDLDAEFEVNVSDYLKNSHMLKIHLDSRRLVLGIKFFLWLII